MGRSHLGELVEPGGGAPIVPPPPEVAGGEGRWRAPDGGSPTPMVPAVPLTPSPSYRSPAALGRTLEVLYVVLVVLGAMSIAAGWMEFVLADRLVEDPTSVAFADVEASDDRVLVIGLGTLAVSVAVIVVFIIWTHRLYCNVPTLGWQPRFTSGWAIGAWFVPFLNLWRPKQIIDEIWRSSATPPEPRHAGTRVSPLLHVWWAVFLAGGFLRNAASMDTSTPEEFRTAAVWSMVADLVWVLASVLAFWVVARTTRRQMVAATAASAAIAGPGPLVEPARSWLKVAVLPAAAIALTFALAAVWAAGLSDAHEASGTPRDEAEGTTFADLRTGDCVDLPDDLSRVYALDVVPCGTGHDAQVAGFVEAPDAMEYPGDDDVASVGNRMCVESFEGYVGGPWIDSGLAVSSFGPMGAGWEQGNRRFTCLATSLDAEPLRRSVEGVGTVLTPEQTTVFNLEQGQCYRDPASAGSLVVELQGCDGPHDNEVYAVVDHPAAPTGDFPGDDVMTAFAIDSCAVEFETRIDPALRQGIAHDWVSRPIELSWHEGHRWVVCGLWDEDFGTLTGSLLGTAGSR